MWPRRGSPSVLCTPGGGQPLIPSCRWCRDGGEMDSSPGVHGGEKSRLVVLQICLPRQDVCEGKAGLGEAGACGGRGSED